MFVIPRGEATEQPAFLATANERDDQQRRRSSDKIAGARQGPGRPDSDCAMIVVLTSIGPNYGQ